MSNWIKCIERMPNQYDVVLGYDNDGSVWTVYYTTGVFVSDVGDYDPVEITHWQPLPEPPVSD